jgi:hypothetical protein
MEPGDDVDPIAHGEISHRRLVYVLEDQPSIGCTFGSLFRGVGGIDERGLHVPNGVELEAHTRDCRVPACD